MKKVYVYNLTSDLVNEVDKVKIDNIESISNGSCSLVICDCLDTVSIADRLSITAELIRKLSIGGKIILKFLSIRSLSKLILSNQISIQDINNIFSSCQSVVDEDFFTQYLNQFDNLQYLENIYEGLFRQVTLERKA